MLCGIYLINCLESKKVYVGQSVHIEARLSHHIWELENNIHPNKHLQNAWNKYGQNSFIFSVIEECDESKLTEREQYWIDFYGGINSKDNYNYRSADARTVSEETKQKISAWHKEHCQDPEVRQQMSIAMTEKHQDPEYRAKFIESQKKKWTPERRKRLSEAKSGKHWSEAHRIARKPFDDAMRGVPRDEAVKKKISDTLKGHAVSEETREKLRQANLGREYAPMSEQARKNISEGAKKGWETRRRNQELKKLQLDLED